MVKVARGTREADTYNISVNIQLKIIVRKNSNHLYYLTIYNRFDIIENKIQNKKFIRMVSNYGTEVSLCYMELQYSR
jgi:hypothetical protein